MNGYKIAQIHNIPSALTSKSEEFEGLKPTDCLPSVWSMFLHNAHGTTISRSSFMIADRFATYSTLVQIRALQNRQNHGRAAIQKPSSYTMWRRECSQRSGRKHLQAHTTS